MWTIKINCRRFLGRLSVSPSDTIAYKNSFWNQYFSVIQSDLRERKERINKLFIGLRLWPTSLPKKYYTAGKTRYVYVKIGNERRDVLGDSRKRYHRPWTEIGKYWPRKEPIRLDLSFLYVSTTSVDTLLLIRLWQQSNSIHRSKASVLVQKLAQFKCFEHVVERKLSGYKGNIIPFHLHGCCSCYPATRYYTSRSYTGRN